MGSKPGLETVQGLGCHYFLGQAVFVFDPKMCIWPQSWLLHRDWVNLFLIPNRKETPCILSLYSSMYFLDAKKIMSDMPDDV